MDYASLFKFIVTKYKTCYKNESYYSNIQLWLEWYKGNVKTFHQSRVINNGIVSLHKDVYGLKMARRVTKDWASAILADGVGIVVNSTNNRSSVFVQGRRMDGGVLGSNNFDEVLSTGLERMFALGTQAFTVELDSVITDEYGNILSSPNAQIRIKSYDATRIIPLNYANGIIKDVAFFSSYCVGETEVYIATVHVLEDDGYVIYNHIINDGRNIQTVVPGLLPVIRTKSFKPLFVIMKTNVSNNIDLDSPMGVSVYSDSIDVLQSVDLTYDAISEDVGTGKRIILMNKKLLCRDSDGKPIAPQDVKQTYMYFYGDELDTQTTPKDKDFIMEFTPQLRTESLCSTLQNQLNMLSANVGLGTKFYNFDISTGVTATEYVGERNDFARNVNKLKMSVQNGVKSLVSGILHMGVVTGRNVDEKANVVVTISDGVIESDTEKRNQDRQDVKDGFMSKLEYRMKWYGETEEEAEKSLSKINNVTQTS